MYQKILKISQPFGWRWWQKVYWHTLVVTILNAFSKQSYEDKNQQTSLNINKTKNTLKTNDVVMSEVNISYSFNMSE